MNFQINFLKNRKIIDTYVYLEGEFGFANLISLDQMYKDDFSDGTLTYYKINK